MPLPELIEIIPLTQPVRAEITVPGSKSITNRALILAALADGEVTLEGALWSEDTQVMTEALKVLGFEIKVENDPEEFCNRRITVKGLGGKIPKAGTAEKPLELFVGNAGTAARFLAALVSLGSGVYRLSGVSRMHDRPQAALFKALRELGYRVESQNGNDKLPARIFGLGLLPNRAVQPLIPKYQESLTVPASSTGLRSCTIDVGESSQFASALLLCAKKAGWWVKIVGESAEESPYVVMTLKLIQVFPKGSGKFSIEPDASSGSYFLATPQLIPEAENLEYSPMLQTKVPTKHFSNVKIAGWPDSGWQVDEKFSDFLLFGELGISGHAEKEIKILELEMVSGGELANYLKKIREQNGISRKDDLGDSIMTAIVLIAAAGQTVVKFLDLGRLRVQECERVIALRTELTKCGAKVIEEGDTLTVYPSKLHGAEIETYDDHRMAMCFAILGLKVPGIKLKNPACVKKTFPNFFQKLAAAPPKGLGVEIRDGAGRKLGTDELFAE